MKLLLPNKKLYAAYEHTISELETNSKYQPKTKKMPCFFQVPALVVEAMILLVFFYIFFLIIQLALFNLVIIGIIYVIGKKIVQLVEALRWKCAFQYRTKDFIQFIESQN